MKEPIILAIESSCDDTSAAVMVGGTLKSNVLASQKVHEQYGGVVPELASRAHQSHIVPVVSEALKQAGISKKELSAVAFTQGPGLLGSLLVGASFAKSLALALDIPLIGVHHMKAHVLAHFIEEPKPKFPFLCLTVSGGHTQLIRVESPLEMHILGQTIDDAVGEAFDKTAKMLGLPYPGGPHIDSWAKKGTVQNYPLPDVQTEGLDFSFSGLKTAILYFLQREVQKNPNFVQENLADICATIQEKLIDTLLKKLKKAAQETQISQIAIAGGVSANSGLRQKLLQEAKSHQWEVFIPKFEYCTDNAAMIAINAHFLYLAKEFVGQDAAPQARLAW
ncbi:tRNA (adenosine(37)-N6)-threonylcarbamoyltransferase complex transferase subunit TsaD [Hugenholtzia roseola]|uniref:tRNA (adenosine(37)-N6)-threonylcarbamoyltransferase complex transferase subunit TsaD n=1 Tax=Hugenholtzia roseola TaxID=1002 RepID=UPI000413398B|nr:tRNA (adenosine(37)-N6)-threonylcarbamoyltransferase complex transferase subunit TsaD [Hugenholtzia roseola]